MARAGLESITPDSLTNPLAFVVEGHPWVDRSVHYHPETIGIDLMKLIQTGLEFDWIELFHDGASSRELPLPSYQ